jgi:hypothetical protein
MADQVCILILDPDEQAAAESIVAFTGRGWRMNWELTGCMTRRRGCTHPRTQVALWGWKWRGGCIMPGLFR